MTKLFTLQISFGHLFMERFVFSYCSLDNSLSLEQHFGKSPLDSYFKRYGVDLECVELGRLLRLLDDFEALSDGLSYSYCFVPVNEYNTVSQFLF